MFFWRCLRSCGAILLSLKNVFVFTMTPKRHFPHHNNIYNFSHSPPSLFLFPFEFRLPADASAVSVPLKQIKNEQRVLIARSIQNLKTLTFESMYKRECIQT